MRIIVTFVLGFLLIAGLPRESLAQQLASKLYAVIFNVTLNSSGKVESLQIVA